MPVSVLQGFMKATGEQDRCVLKRETKSTGGGSASRSLSRFLNFIHHAFLFTSSLCHEAEGKQTLCKCWESSLLVCMGPVI